MWWAWSLLCQVHGSVLQSKTGSLLLLMIVSSALFVVDISLLEMLCLLSFFYRSLSNGVALSITVCHHRKEYALVNTFYC